MSVFLRPDEWWDHYRCGNILEEEVLYKGKALVFTIAQTCPSQTENPQSQSSHLASSW